ncbi:MAG: system killer suppression protein [Rhodospirillales bacterium]|nr:system killer suppression protein [Rhodospirillales bacterium]
MKKAFGDRAPALMRRLSVLREARTLADVPRVPPERCHELTGRREGQLAVVIKDNWRLVFRPAHDPPPRKPDGGLDHSQVTEIELIEVVDYHGE